MALSDCIYRTSYNYFMPLSLLKKKKTKKLYLFTRKTFILVSTLNQFLMNNELTILCACELFQMSKLLLKFTFSLHVTECLIDYALGIAATSSDSHGILTTGWAWTQRGCSKREKGGLFLQCHHFLPALQNNSKLLFGWKPKPFS